MKNITLTSLCTAAFVAILFSGNVMAQLNFTVNSLADDLQAYAYDDPNTPVDESEDGICRDEAGRCTVRAALEEAFNMDQSVHVTFGVSGTIELLYQLELPDGSTLDGNNQVTLSNPLVILDMDEACTVLGLSFSGALVGVNVQGDNNKIGTTTGNTNEFLNCQTGITISGDNNIVSNNFIGITADGVLQPCGTGVLVAGDDNQIGQDAVNASNIICGNTVAGILIGEGTGNIIEGNSIGTDLEQRAGLGNALGIMITSDNNLVGGQGTFSTNVISGNQIAVALQAAPPDVLADNNKIVNNIIGLNKFENVALPNQNGIMITNGVTNALIYDNTIAGNAGTGVGIFGYDEESLTTGHLIYRNKIGVNRYNVEFANVTGISLFGYVENVAIGVNAFNEYIPNTIAGNTQAGLELRSFAGFSPDHVVFRKNIIHSNGTNVALDPGVNSGLGTPFGLSFSNRTLAGIHALPSMLIDVYREDESELSPSANEWLGATFTDAVGVFSFEITDTTVQAVSVTATNTAASSTSGLADILLVTAVDEEIGTTSASPQVRVHPNPFDHRTTISLTIGDQGMTRLRVLTMTGQEVARLVNSPLSAGQHDIEFDASGLSPGMYFYELNVGSSSRTGKMIIAR